MKNKVLTDEQRKVLIEKIKTYFLDELDFEIGDLKSGFILNFIEKDIIPIYYNNAVYDCMKFINEKTDDMQILIKEE